MTCRSSRCAPPSCPARRRRAERRGRRPRGARARSSATARRRRRRTNAEADGDRIDPASPTPARLAEQAAEKLRLSARGFTRVLRVARTIADLARSPEVRRVDVAEALAFRHRIPGRL